MAKEVEYYKGDFCPNCKVWFDMNEDGDGIKGGVEMGCGEAVPCCRSMHTPAELLRAEYPERMVTLNCCPKCGAVVSIMVSDVDGGYLYVRDTREL